MEELKPCPFCGGEAIPCSTRNHFATEKFFVSCGVCGVETPRIARTRNKAIAAWNSRTGKDINVATNNAVPVVRGEWKRDIGDRHSSGEYRYCTACGGNAFHLYGMIRNYKYCPNCGAKMEVEP